MSGAVIRAPVPAILLCLTCAGGHAVAQCDRLELGLRLRAVERRLLDTTDAERRRAAFAAMASAVQAFFRLDSGAVAQALHRADLALRGVADDEVAAHAAAHFVSCRRRLLATGEPLALTMRLAWRAPPPGTDPGPWTVHWRCNGAPRADWPPTPLAELPATLTLPTTDLPEGDHQLGWTLHAGERSFAPRQQGFSVVRERDARLLTLATRLADAPATLEAGSARELLRLLQVMGKPVPEETLLPGARLLATAEALAAAPDRAWFGRDRPGQFWWRAPGSGRVARLAVPEAGPGPWPVVLALHGAGGSENLFCDGYGDGEIVRLCAARGWLLCAPRSAPAAAVDLAAWVDLLQSRYPIDRDRIFVVGHSMGAMQAAAATGRDPGLVRALGLIGGAGNGRGLDRLPVFLATGGADFARGQVAALHAQLAPAGRCELLDLPHVDHLTVVQEALPGLFRFFDGHTGAR